MFSITRGDTRYSLNLIPLGGFVKIFGEQGEGATDPQSFASKSIATRIGIVSAGVIMNVVLAYVLLTGGYVYGLPTTLDDDASNARDIAIAVVSVLPKTPAYDAGIAVGDKIISINGETFSAIPALQEYVNTHVGEQLTLELQHGAEHIKKELTPVVLEETKKGGMGLGLARVGLVSYSIPMAFVQAGETTARLIGAIVGSFVTLVAGVVQQGKVSADIAGPVGVAVLTGQSAAMGLPYLLQFMALLSLNLA